MSVESNSSQHGSAKARLQILNATEGTLVTPDVVEIDTATGAFTAVARRLKNIASGGIWLNPYRGIPRVSFMPELDIIYLNEHFEVLCCIENYRQAAMELPQIEANSAIILPAGRLAAARIKSEDRLEIRESETGVLRVSLAPSASEVGIAVSDETDSATRKPATAFRSFFTRLLRISSDRRRGKRHVIPGSVAYISIGSPQAQEVRDISTDGFYVRTEHRWPKGSSLLVGLEIVNPASREVEAMISVRSKVVRTGTDGIGFVFDDEPGNRDPLLGATDPEHLVQLQKFMQRIQRG